MAVRVLLVDDSEVYRSAMELVLRREPDLEIVGTAADGAHARVQARDLEPDVVVLDFRLPGGDGSTVAAELIADRPELTVLCLTAEATTQERADVLAAGAAAVVEKGDLEALLAAIRSFG